MDLSTHPSFIEILRDVSRSDNLFTLAAIHVDSDEMITGEQPGARAGCVWRHAFGNYTILRINPGYPVPGGHLMPHALAKIKHSGRDQQARADQQDPGLGCKYRSLHGL